MTPALALLALFAGLRALAWLAVHQVTVGALRRLVRREGLDLSPGSQVRDASVDALGSNPGLEARYLPFDIRPGQVGILRGESLPGATYLSVVLYDRLLQSLPGRTWVVDPPRDERGRFTLVLAHEDLGVPGWLDITGAPEGVIWERHVGGAPTERSSLEILSDSYAHPRCPSS